MDSLGQSTTPSIEVPPTTIPTGKRILGLNSEITCKYGTPKPSGKGPTELSERLMEKYKLPKKFTHLVYWELICRDPDVFGAPLAELVNSDRFECGELEEAYETCCCEVKCNDQFWVRDTLTGVRLEPIGSECIKRFNKKAGETTSKIVKRNQLRREIERDGIEKVARNRKRHICGVCKSELVDMSKKWGKTYKICNKCVAEKPHRIPVKDISTKPLKNVDQPLWETRYQSQPLPWYISLHLDKEGDEYIHHKTNDDTYFIDKSYGIRLDYKSSEWIFKIKSHNESEIHNYGDVDISCKRCGTKFTSSAMHPSMEIFGKRIPTDDSMCHDCSLESPLTVYKSMRITTPDMPTSILQLYKTNKPHYTRLKTRLTYPGERCTKCTNQLDMRTARSERNAGRLMKWCHTCYRRTKSGFSGWIDDPNELKKPHPNALMYATLFEAFERFITDKPHLLDSIKQYNISKQHQKKIVSAWYTS